MPVSVVRWQFYDPVTLQTLTFEINPDDGGSPAYAKTITYANTSAPNGAVLIFEGRDQVQKLEWSGTLLTQTHFTAYTTWWAKRYQVQLTDDLGRIFQIVVESFTPTRKRSALYPWKHTYKVVATVVG